MTYHANTGRDAAREAARRSNGEFGTQVRAEATVDLIDDNRVDPTPDRHDSLQTDAPIVALTLHTHDGPVRGLAQMVEDGELDLNPPYQRGSLWSTRQRQLLIKSMMMNLPIPPVTINDRWAAHFRDADGTTIQDQLAQGTFTPSYGVVDGKQRIETVHAWTQDGFGVPASWFEPDSVETTYETADGPYVKWSGLSVAGRTRFATSVKLPRTTATVSTLEEEAELYLLLNGGGVAQTDADMDRAARVASGEEVR